MRSRGVAAVLAISIVASGCSLLSAAVRPTSSGSAPSADALVPALSVTNPEIAIAPDANLLDGQAVIVSVRGFGIGSIIYLSECATAAAVTDLGCGAELAGQVRLVTNERRSGVASFIVSATTSAGPGTTHQVESCDDRCVIVATLGGGYPFVSAGISFEAP